MDPKRIEEFRRKLREGRPVRVVGGQVQLADAPQQQAVGHKPVPGQTVPSQNGGGVAVKPHEWGAGP